MNYNHLKYFEILAKNQHYSHAAEELGINKPSLSRIIKNLENELDVVLFEKKGRNIVLTKCGQILYEYVSDGFSRIEEGKNKILELLDPTKGVIDLGFVYTLSAHIFPDIFQKFSKIPGNEKFVFRFYQDNTPELLEKLKSRQCDIVFCSYFDNEPDIEFIPIIKQEEVIMVSKNHALAKKDSVTLAEACKYPFVYFPDKSNFLNHMFECAGVKPNIRCYVEEDNAIAGLVSINYGIAIIPRNNIFNHLNIKMLNIIDEPHHRIVYMATVKNRCISPAAQIFKKHILSMVKDGQYYNA